MPRIYYHPGQGGDAISLDGPLSYVGAGSGLRSRNWNRAITNKAVRGLSLGVREVKVEVMAYDQAADDLRRAADADNSAKTPGTLTVDGEWNMRCFIVASELSEAYYEAVRLKLTLALVDPCWWREKSRHFVTGLDAGGIDHPYDYPHDLSFAVGSGTLDVDSPQGAPCSITFYGPCTNPYVVIGGNRYEVDVSVNSGYTVVIDALGSRPTVERIDNQGNRESVFSYAERDGGLGGGSYAFQPLPHGVSTVEWSGAFAFDVTWRELDTEPPWAR